MGYIKKILICTLDQSNFYPYKFKGKKLGCLLFTVISESWRSFRPVCIVRRRILSGEKIITIRSSKKQKR